MNFSWHKAGTAVVLAAALTSAPVALAADQAAKGDTSGPAVGSPPTPSAAVQKQTSSQPGAASGAPGVEAKSGTEGGATAKPPSGGNSASQR